MYGCVAPSSAGKSAAQPLGAQGRGSITFPMLTHTRCRPPADVPADRSPTGAEAFPRTNSGVGDELEQGSVRVVEVDAVADPERSLAFDRPFDDRD